MYRPIWVMPKIYVKIQQIAGENRRAIEGQVGEWATACRHKDPDRLQPVGKTTLQIDYDAHIIFEHVVIFRCRDCGELVVVRGFDADERVKAAGVRKMGGKEPGPLLGYVQEG